MQRFLSFGYLSVIVGGLLLALGSALSLTVTVEPFSAKAATGVFVVSSVLRLLGAMALIVGITAVYVRESDVAGRLGLAAYVLVIGNLVLQAGWMWSDTFVAGTLATNAPGVLDGTVEDPRLTAGFLIAWFMNAAFILLGIATLRARVFARTVGWAFVAIGVVTLVPLPFDGPVYEVLIGSACVVAGVFARRPTKDQSSAFARLLGDQILLPMS
jgi:hypothetical protein